MIYLSADLHCGHFNIIEYCKRPFKTVEEMNQVIMNNWNATVKEEDTVYLLGDYAFYRGISEDWHLNGHIILIRGNHDRGFSDTKLKRFSIETVHKMPLTITHELEGAIVDIVLMHAPNQRHMNKVNFCGHVHDKWLYNDGFYNVGVDVHGFKPILLDDAIKDYRQHMYKEFGEGNK